MDSVTTEPPFNLENSHYFNHNNDHRFAGSAPYTCTPLPPLPSCDTAGVIVAFRRVSCISTVFFLFATFAAMKFWLDLSPHDPEVFIESATLSSFPVIHKGPVQFTADFDIYFSIRNPNHKMSLYMDRVNAAVLFGYPNNYKNGDPRTVISEINLPSFQSGIQDTTTLRSNFTASRLHMDPNLASIALNSRVIDQNISVDFNFKALVRFATRKWRTRAYRVNAMCGNLIFVFDNSSTPNAILQGTSRKCHLTI